MLNSIGSAHAAGVYASAYRFIEVSNTILLAIFSRSYPEFFAHGENGLRSAFEFGKRLLPVVTGLGALSFAGYMISAPLIPKILGPEFAESLPALRLLAIVPLITGLQWVAADTFSGAGDQKLRSVVQVGTAVLNGFLNFGLIPTYSWKGAVAATLISETTRTTILWLAFTKKLKLFSKNKTPNNESL